MRRIAIDVLSKVARIERTEANPGGEVGASVINEKNELVL